MPDAVSNLLFETTTAYAHYQVWDTVYGGRPARVLYSGNRHTAQSGVPTDDRPDMLFDYNQRFLELLSAIQPARILLVGGGVYTLPMAALAACPHTRIDVVEIDAGLDDIATNYFNLRPNPRLRIVHADGREFLDHTRQMYDVILIDAFVHAVTPVELRTIAAVQSYHRRLASPGLVARNLISSYYGQDAGGLRRQLQKYQAVFGQASIFPASANIPLGVSQNLLLIAQKGPGRPLDKYLRFPSLGV